jgi:uncharacterized delta-60 repeat protein
MVRTLPGRLTSNFTAAIFSRLLTCMVLAAVPTIALAQAGHLDPTFGHNGIFSDSFNGVGTVVATVVALQSDGKIVVGGENANFGGVIRLNPNGTLDTSFGSAGIVNLKFRVIDNIVTGLAIQPNGQILVSGTGIPGGGQLYRLEANGNVDTTFGGGGSVFLFPGNPGQVVLQPDGRIVVAESGGGVTQLQRFESNGQLDSSFGTGGTAPLISSGAIALQSDGTFLVSSSPVAKYKSNGSIDTTFGILGQGPVLPNMTSGIAVQTNARVVTAGSVTTVLGLTGNSTGFGLMRFLSSGLPDTTFGTRGGVSTSFSGSPQTAASSLAIQSNGDLVAAGSAGTASTQSFALARYLGSTGQLDSTFGTGGRVTTSFGSNKLAAISSIVLQTDGKIVVVGNVNSSTYTVARYLVQ